VLACYVEHVLKRRGQRSIYTREQTLHYLAVLASQLERHGQVEFSLERMQPNWLPQRQQHQYRRWIVRLFYCLETLSLSIFFASFYGDPVSFSSGPLAWVAGKPSNEVLGWMALGLGGGFQNVTSFAVLLTVIFLLIFVLAGRVSRAHPLRLSWSLLLKRAWEGCRRGFCFGLVSGLLACFFLSLWGGIPYGLYRGFGIACLSGLCMSFASGCLALFPAPEPQNASKRGVRERLTDCVLYTLCSTCGYGLVYDVLSHESHLLILIYALIVGCPSGIIFGLANGTRLVEGMGEQIQPAEVASWQWVSWRQVLEQVRNGFLLGSWVFLAVSITFLCVAGLSQGFVYGLRYGLLFGVLAGGIGALTALFAGLFEAWVTRMSDAEERALQRPHEGLSRSLRHAVKASLIFAALGGCGGGGISALAFALTGVPGWPLLGFRFAMICGSRFAFQFFFFHGGLAWIEHMLLRFWLWRRGAIPWNYPQFLDFAVERMLLYRMGSEYRFAHRMLQEYFATYRKNEGEEENLCADRPVHPDLMPL
jgi:hypothetical protein